MKTRHNSSRLANKSTPTTATSATTTTYHVKKETSTSATKVNFPLKHPPTTTTTAAVALKKQKADRQAQQKHSRRDPKVRGIHTDAIRFDYAPTSAATCQGCQKVITKGELRWGLKYGGNPIAEEHVIPLYGTHPMYMSFHRGCGFGFARYSALEKANPTWLATRTCHLCQTTPTRGTTDLRLRLGGQRRTDKKVTFHAGFHLECVRNAFIKECTRQQLSTKLVPCIGDEKICHGTQGGVQWEDLTEVERKHIAQVFANK
eukprot:m.270587 g.270587  ORF g.270587 m.270587 type:complete len:260 (+) comp90708_c0_seq1:253-1032(+)